MDIRLGCGDSGLGGAVGGDALIDRLLGDGAFRVGRLVTPHRGPREIKVGLLQIQVPLGLPKVGFALPQLLVDLGRSDLRQELACLHGVPDVYVPLAEVPAGAGVDDRVLTGLGRGGQRQIRSGRGLGPDDVHFRRSGPHRLGGDRQLALISHTGKDTDQ